MVRDYWISCTDINRFRRDEMEIIKNIALITTGLVVGVMVGREGQI